MTTAITTIEDLKKNLVSEHMKTLNNFFSNDEKKTLKFLSAVAYCAQSTPKLLECSQATIISAFIFIIFAFVLKHLNTTFSQVL